MAVGHRQVETIIAQSRRALEYLRPDNLTYRTSTTWKLGVAYEFQGDRAAAGQAFREAISISQASGNVYTLILATTGLGNIQLAENQLHLAAKTYRRVLELVGDSPIPVACHIHLCLARICYEWNDLSAALRHGQQSLQLAQPYQDTHDILVACEVLLARLKLAQGEVAGAAALLTKAEQSASRRNFEYQMPEIATVQVLTLLRQGNLAAAAHLAHTHDLPICQARVHLAQGNASAAQVALEPLRLQAEAKDLADEQLKLLVIQALIYQAHGETEKAVQLLGEALTLAEPEGFIRIFVDEGQTMARLLHQVLNRGIEPMYVRRLLSAFPMDEQVQNNTKTSSTDQSSLIEPLSERELEVLQYIAEGLTNREIADRLYISLNTVKVHARNIYGKVNVNNRTQAVARARELGILSQS